MTGGRRLRIGLLGNRAHQLLFAPLFAARDDCEIVAAADHVRAKGEPLARAFAVPLLDDYDAVLDDPSIDVVSIATDFYLKHALIARAVAGGKHVLVDKPIGRTLQEAQAVLHACEGQASRVLLTYPLRFEPATQWLAGEIRAGRIADIASYTHHWVRQFPDSDLMSYVSYPTEARINGGGELMNHGNHAVDLMVSLFGRPLRVQCAMQNLYWDEYRAFGTEDFAQLVADYGRFRAQVVTGRNRVPVDGLPNVHSIDLVARGQHVRVDGERVQINGTAMDLPSAALAARAACVQHLVDCIATGEEPVSGVHNGLTVAEVTVAAYQSAQHGGWVGLPLSDPQHPLIDAGEALLPGPLAGV